ncbi:MAG TPA: 5-oxoprolinase subunit PxpB [Sediminibacterium sp.]|nr:5-oxoprolinase subunit PxpB [Sediminibacterium sp.]
MESLIYPNSDHGITLAVAAESGEQAYQRLLAVFRILQADPLPGIMDIIPAMNTLTVIYDPLQVPVPDQGSAYLFLREKLSAIWEVPDNSIAKSPVSIRIPVCYDSRLGPDLESLAAAHALSVEEVIQIHCSPVYKVYLLGFLPGFAYLGNVDPRIQTARKSSPRLLVPAGSVGIAGMQTGIYPLASPGGWQLIGRTPLSVFEPDAIPPCRLQPGDQVQFYPITLEAFTSWQHR